MDTSYYLIPANNFDTAFFPKFGTVYLPATGHYTIYANPGPILPNPGVEITDTGLYVMQYKEPTIQLYETGATDTPPVYVKCDSEINGYQEDYYADGVLKMRGNFKNGNPKDSLVTFYPNGNLKRQLVYLAKIIILKEYDSLGNLLRLTKTENKGFMIYREHAEKTFFPNGTIASEESSVKHVVRRLEYYQSGQIKLRQTKSHRIEYYENGLKSQEFKWKAKSDRVGKDTKRDFTIYRTTYDQKKQVIQSAVYEDWGYYIPQPNISISKSDWIVSFIKYQAGKEIFVVKDMETKDFLNKYADDFVD